jgi:homoserine kinase
VTSCQASRQTSTVRVPASSGNLGPGFDALGLALALHDEVRVDVTGSGGVAVEVTGEGAGSLRCDEHHLVVRALLATLAALGARRPPGITLRCHNAIPHERGLGSSGAAAVAGVAAGYALAGVKLDDAERAGRALRLAADFDGHADNVAPSLLGGLTIVWSAGAGWQAVRAEPHAALVPVLLVPATTSSTAQTRGLLPDTVPHPDAALTAGRAALAVHAMTARPDLLLPATEDRLHQPYRRPAYPPTARLMDALRAAGVPAVVSGAGPTVLALTTGEPLPEHVDVAGFTARHLPIERAGVQVSHGEQPVRDSARNIGP